LCVARWRESLDFAAALGAVVVAGQIQHDATQVGALLAGFWPRVGVVAPDERVVHDILGDRAVTAGQHGEAQQRGGMELVQLLQSLGWVPHRVHISMTPQGTPRLTKRGKISVPNGRRRRDIHDSDTWTSPCATYRGIVRFVPWRVPPTSWTRDFSPASAAVVLLVWPALWAHLVFGPMGFVAVAAIPVVIWMGMKALRLRRSSRTTHELRPCVVFGSDTLSPTDLCPTHRQTTRRSQTAK
jgi:hypothetical protein